MGRSRNIIEKLETKKVEKTNEDEKSKKIINDLINTGWSGDNESQMKAVQLLKGLSNI
jgi:hypothetical protein